MGGKGTDLDLNKNIEKLVEENMALVHSLIKRFLNRGIEYDDLFQIGCIGLYNAARRYNKDLGFAFSTYASSLIIGEVKRFLRDDGIIKVSRSIRELSVKINVYSAKFFQENGREVTVNELSKFLGATVEEILAALEATKTPASIYEENSCGKTIADTVVCNKEESREIIDRILLLQVINTFNKRDQKIIIYRYFKDKTQKETAGILGISQVQVSRIEKKLLEKIKEAFRA